MTTYSVPISFFPGVARVPLRELRGADELSVTGAGTPDAIALLDRLLPETEDNDIRAGQAAQLTAADRDQALAGVYRHTYGDRIESSIRCENCEAPFDVDFRLDDLQRHLYREEEPPALTVTEEGAFQLPDGRLFRLPTGRDECLALEQSGVSAEEVLLSNCLPREVDKAGREEVLEVMQQVAPVFHLDLEAICPECGQKQSIHFDLQHYLLSSFLQERKQLIHEIHLLAKAYHWSRTEILAIPRSIRQMHVALLEGAY